jgi:hypothetical protein
VKPNSSEGKKVFEEMIKFANKIVEENKLNLNKEKKFKVDLESVFRDEPGKKERGLEREDHKRRKPQPRLQLVVLATAAVVVVHLAAADVDLAAVDVDLPAVDVVLATAAVVVDLAAADVDLAAVDVDLPAVDVVLATGAVFLAAAAVGGDAADVGLG